MNYENIIDDLKDLLYITKFVPETKEIKKQRKKIKKVIKKLMEDDYDDIIEIR